MELLHQVRNELLSEAAASPAMLTDIAGLERYISESYANRTFIELLQNADDAGAREVTFVQGNNWVLAANSGRPFSEEDFRSVCRSASSKKSRGESIGYRGIGFKSVVGISDRVHLISGNLSATFDRDLTRSALNLGDTAVPLVRIPHPLNLTDSELIQQVQKLKRAGFQTFFILAGIDGVQVENEFEKFDSDHLLFLRNVEKVKNSFNRHEVFTCLRTTAHDGSIELATTSPSSRETWRIQSSGDVSIAVATESGLAVPLQRSESLVHAFLPTQEEAGIPVRINGDFSTDPSRTRVVLDEDTDRQLDELAKLVNSILTEAVPPNDRFEVGLIECLTPYVDDVTLQFERSSFRVALATKLRSHLAPVRDQLALGPPWLNNDDSDALSRVTGKLVIHRNSVSPSPLAQLATFLDSETVGSDAVLDAARNDLISSSGFAEFIAHVVGSVIPTSVSFLDLTPLPHWPSSAGPATLAEIADKSLSFEEEFLKAVEVSGLPIPTLRRRAVEFDPRLDEAFSTVDEESQIASAMTKGPAASPANGERIQVDPFAPGTTIKTEDLKSHTALSDWRSAEKFVHEVLEAQFGFRVEDRTRQNVGYDLWASSGSEDFYIEVKSLAYPGQAFALTPNEDSFARDHGSHFVLALVLRTVDEVSIQFIRSPRSSLQFERQCRQWVWECNHYKFEAQFVLRI